jgi:hypothetical protein
MGRTVYEHFPTSASVRPSETAAPATRMEARTASAGTTQVPPAQLLAAGDGAPEYRGVAVHVCN